jgi:pyruvate dehydrogenase E2 component (dihydrolipoamide acetyltransferase)
MAQIVEVKVPDIGDFKDVPIIELLVKVGDEVKAEDSLMTLESDKATMDIPSPVSGVVTELKVKVGDKVAEGVVLAHGKTCAEVDAVAAAANAAAAPAAATATPVAAPCPGCAGRRPVAASGADFRPGDAERCTAPPPRCHADAGRAPDRRRAHASPSVRAFARELGVDVRKLTGTGPKARITQADVTAYVKGVMIGAATAVLPAPTSGTGLDLLPWPKVDFAKFGPVEAKPLSRIKKISGANLSRNWGNDSPCHAV